MGWPQQDSLSPPPLLQLGQAGRWSAVEVWWNLMSPVRTCVCRQLCGRPTELLSLAAWAQRLKLISFHTQMYSDDYSPLSSVSFKKGVKAVGQIFMYESPEGGGWMLGFHARNSRSLRSMKCMRLSELPLVGSCFKTGWFGVCFCWVFFLKKKRKRWFMRGKALKEGWDATFFQYQQSL